MIEDLCEFDLSIVKGFSCFLIIDWQWFSAGCAEIQEFEIPCSYLNLAENTEEIFEIDNMKTSKIKPKNVEKGMHFDLVRAIVGDEIRLLQAPGVKPEWPKNQPKKGVWILTGKAYTDENSATFVNFDDEFNVVSIGRASNR